MIWLFSSKHVQLLLDAQAYKIKELRTQLEQLQSHIYTDNTETLTNALKEIERLKERISTRNINLANISNELAELRAQLQSAPAERELALLREYRLSTIACNNSHGVETDTLEEAVELERKAEERVEAAEKACWEFYRLNPAPATADSDVREVK